MTKEILVKPNGSDMYRKAKIVGVEIDEQQTAMTGDYVSTFNFVVEYSDGDDAGTQDTVQQAFVMVVRSDGQEDMNRGRNWRPVYGNMK